MADPRLRKRSTRLSESDLLTLEEPPRKRTKRKKSPDEGLDSPVGRPKRRRGGGSSTPPLRAGTKKGRGSRITKEDRNGHSQKGDGRRRRGNKLMVSLNIQDNDLLVSKQVESGVRGTMPRPRGRGGRLANQQRDQSVVSDAGSNNGSGIGNGKILSFKNPNFSFACVGTGKKRVWRNLKQMLASERALSLGPDTVTYSSIDAPPSFKPVKKYSDLTGLIGKYTDPLTGLFFSTSEEFQVVRTLPQDVVQGYLALRGKLTIT